MGSRAVREARRIADEVLFPAAVTVDAADRVPAELFEAMAAGGFYAIGAPEESGLDLTDDDRAGVIEAFAGGCLSAAFVWLQHRGALKAVAASGNTELRESSVADLRAGRLRAGLAIGAATRTGPPMLRARRVDGGWSLTGSAPWFTGWGMVEVLLMAARDADDLVVWALVDTRSAALRADPLSLLAVQASGTVMLSVTDLVVPDRRVVSTQPHADYLARDAESLSTNGFLSTGLTARAIALMAADGLGSASAPPPAARLADQLAQVRARLLHATTDDAPSARAASSELALRAAAALAVHEGSRSVLRTSHTARLIREATFLLTFGTRPPIRADLLARLTNGWQV